MRIASPINPMLLAVCLCWFGHRSPAADVTFNQEIAPILHRHCAACHRPGEAAPFPLLTYEQAVKKGPAVVKATRSRQMPPWKAEPASYPYRDERRLSESEIKLLETWVNGGMKEGSGPKPRIPTFPDGWTLGTPDLVVEMNAPFKVPADGPDIYRNFALPLGLSEDKWITAIDMRPTARAAVHHVLYFADPSGKAKTLQKGDQPGFTGMRAGGVTAPLGGWAVGMPPHFFPDGLAVRLPKGADLVAQFHFHPTGKAESEKAQVGIYFAKAPPERTLVRIQMPPIYSLFSGLHIPAGEKDFVIRDSYTLPVAIHAVGVGAHAHYLGKHLKMTAKIPNQGEKVLLEIKDWDFAWQDRYYFQKMVPLPAGTRLDVEIHWDNSADNPRNPTRPPVAVSWGEESKDEMGSMSLMAVAQVESERGDLERDLNRKRSEMVRSRLLAEPGLAKKIAELLGQ